MNQFNEGDKVMILNGDRCGEFGLACSSDGEFTAVHLNGQIFTYHNSSLKLEEECVFSDGDLIPEIYDNQFLADSINGGRIVNIMVDTSNKCQENDTEFLTKSILPEDSKGRKTFPVYSGCIKYFPDALCAVSKRSYIGNEQHNSGSSLHWDRSKSGDELDALERHIMQEDWDCVAWRALANLQKKLEQGWRPKDW